MVTGSNPAAVNTHLILAIVNILHADYYYYYYYYIVGRTYYLLQILATLYLPGRPTN
jgi:hypothetical protein